MNKVKLALHVFAQILAQGAIAALVPATQDKYYAALVAVVGVLVAYFDVPQA